MSFIRPDAGAALHRWRESIIGLAATLLGLWWIFVSGGLLFWIGLVIVPVALSFAFLGFQRGQFRTGTHGPGVVQVDEGRVIYFGPLSGGVVDLEDIAEIRIDTTGKPAHWVLRGSNHDSLFIPVNAAGSEKLLDAFAMLPGFQGAKALAAQTSDCKTSSVIWWREKQSAAPLIGEPRV